MRDIGLIVRDSDQFINSNNTKKMMKTTSLMTIMSFFMLSSFGQNKLIILGSAHIESENLTLKLYEHIIDSIKPDLILFELDSSDMTADFGFKKAMLDFIATSKNEKGQQSFFEVSAVNNYVLKNPKTLLRPYDIPNRDKYFFENNYLENEANFENDLKSLYNKDSLSIENYIIVSHYLKLKQIDSLILVSDIRTLNSETSDNFFKYFFEWRERNLIKLVQSIPSLKKYESFIKFDTSFWRLRNDAMVQNIIRYTKEYKNKKILVVTGTYHRYYLNMKLNTVDYNDKFTLVNLFD